MRPPKAKIKPTELSIHGHNRIDNYYWLKEREDPKVIAYLNAENAYLDKKMAHTKPFQEELFKEIVARFAQTDMSVPYKYHGYWYITRYEEGQEYAIYSRKKESLDAVEEIMLNENEMAKGHSYYKIGGRSVSPDNKWLAYGVDTVSRRIFTIHFKNLETGETLEESLDNTTGSCVWANDNKTIFYQRKDESLRSFKIFRHTIGSDPNLDVCVWHETDETFGCVIYKTKSEKYLVIGSFSTVSNEYQILEADNPDGDFRLFEPRERHHEHSIDHAGDAFYILTNWNAKNFKLMTFSDVAILPKSKIQNPKSTEGVTFKANWTDLIPHRPDVLLEGMDNFKDYLVLSERQNGLTKLQILPKNGDTAFYINFNEEVYMAYTGMNPDYEATTLRLGYTSLTTPNSVYDYTFETKEFALLKREAVLDEQFSPENYHTQRLYATATDGVKVPISLVYNKNKVKKGKKSPLLLYAYGSYGHSMDPYFSSARLSLLDRGFVFAIAHIRGGQELGRWWYDDGKLLKKKNTFTDFIACAEYLIDEGYTSSQKLFGMGGSAGGLLMGAVINMKPEIFKGVIAAVPFVDVVTTMLDESIPLTTGEFDEWGNPKDKAFHDYMLSYSPYDNVETKPYPAMLVTTGLHDSQVQYWEPAKWVAKLRVMKTDKKPLYLYCNMTTGHGGASGRFERFKETAMEWAFLLDLAGM
jgi:oligopeptidase B